MYKTIILLISITTAFGNVLPPYASKYICHTSWSNFTSCLVENTNEGIRALKNGVPEADISPLDPYHLDSFRVVAGGIGLLIKMTMKNITIYGKSNTTVHSFVINPALRTAQLNFTTPWLRINSYYDAIGNILGVPIIGAAYFDGNFTDVREIMKFTYVKVNINGTDYYRVSSMHFKGNVKGSANIKLTATDPKNQAQVTRLQDFFNDNYRLVLRTVNPWTNFYSAKFYTDMINGILSKVPANEILPE